MNDDFIGLPPIGVTPPVVTITIPEGNALSVATVENGTIATLTSPDGTFLSETTISTISGVTTTTIIDATLLSTATVTNAGGDVVTVTSIQPIDLSTNSQTIAIENWVENTKDTTLNYLTSGADPQSVTTITELDTGVIISVTTVSADDVNDPNRALMRGFRALVIEGAETQEAKYSAPDPVTGFITVATSFADGTQELALATSTGIVLNVSNVSAEVDGVRTTQDFNAENVHTTNTTHTTDPLTGLVDSVTLDLSNNVIETKTSSFADGVTTVIVRDSNGSVVSTTTSSTMNGDTIEEIVYATGYIVRTNQKNNIVFKSEVTMPLNESNEIIKTVRGKLTGETTVITLDSQNVETQRTTISVDPITLDFVSRVDILQQTDGTSVDNTYDVDNQLQTTEYTESLGNGSTRRVKADANGYSVLSYISQTTVNGVETLIETDPIGGLIATTIIETTDGEMVVERTDGTSLHVTTTTTNTQTNEVVSSTVYIPLNTTVHQYTVSSSNQITPALTAFEVGHKYSFTLEAGTTLAIGSNPSTYGWTVAYVNEGTNLEFIVPASVDSLKVFNDIIPVNIPSNLDFYNTSTTITTASSGIKAYVVHDSSNSIIATASRSPDGSSFVYAQVDGELRGSQTTFPSGETRHKRTLTTNALEYTTNAASEINYRRYTYKDATRRWIVQQKTDGSFVRKQFTFENSFVERSETELGDFEYNNYIDTTTYYETSAQRAALGNGYVFPSDYTSTIPDELKLYYRIEVVDGVRTDLLGYLAASNTIIERVYDGPSSSGSVVELRTISTQGLNKTTVIRNLANVVLRTQVTTTTNDTTTTTTSSVDETISVETKTVANGVTTKRFLDVITNNERTTSRDSTNGLLVQHTLVGDLVANEITSTFRFSDHSRKIQVKNMSDSVLRKVEISKPDKDNKRVRVEEIPATNQVITQTLDVSEAVIDQSTVTTSEVDGNSVVHTQNLDTSESTVTYDPDDEIIESVTFKSPDAHRLREKVHYIKHSLGGHTSILSMVDATNNQVGTKATSVVQLSGAKIVTTTNETDTLVYTDTVTSPDIRGAVSRTRVMASGRESSSTVRSDGSVIEIVRDVSNTPLYTTTTSRPHPVTGNVKIRIRYTDGRPDVNRVKASNGTVLSDDTPEPDSSANTVRIVANQVPQDHLVIAEIRLYDIAENLLTYNTMLNSTDNEVWISPQTGGSSTVEEAIQGLSDNNVNQPQLVFGNAIATDGNAAWTNGATLLTLTPTTETPVHKVEIYFASLEYSASLKILLGNYQEFAEVDKFVDYLTVDGVLTKPWTETNDLDALLHHEIIQAPAPTFLTEVTGPTDVLVYLSSNDTADSLTTHHPQTTSYTIEYKQTSAPGTGWMSRTTSNMTATYRLDAEEVQSNSVYDVRVVKNNSQLSPVSPTLSFTTSPTPASAPTLNVTAKTGQTISLSWTDNNNGDASVTGYAVEYSDATQVPTTPSGQVTITIIDWAVYYKIMNVNEFRLTDINGVIIPYMITQTGTWSNPWSGVLNDVKTPLTNTSWRSSDYALGNSFILTPIDSSAIVYRVDLVYNQANYSPTMDITIGGATIRVLKMTTSGPNALDTPFEDMEKQTAVFRTWNTAASLTDNTASSYTLSGLSINTPYHIRLTKQTGVNNPHTMLSSTTMDQASAPTLETTARTTNSLSLAWIANANSGATVTDYLIEYKAQLASVWTGVVVSNSVSSYILNELSSNTVYDLRVTKRTDLNNAMSSIISDSTTKVEALPPTLSVASKTPTSITLGWVSNSNGDAGLTGYELEYKKASEMTFASVAVVSTSKTLIGLESNTAYDFRVTKITDLNSPVSSVVTDSTAKVEALPPTLSVTSKTVSSVSLSWVENDNGDALMNSNTPRTINLTITDMPTIGQNATVLTELSFYKQDGTVCDYQLTYIGFTEYIINSPSTLDGKKDALTDSQNGSYVNWRFEGLNSSTETAPIFNNILLSAEIPRDAFKMVTKWYDNTRTPNFRIDFVEDPSFGINIDRDDINDYRDTYFTEDGTSTGLFALTVGHPYLLEYKTQLASIWTGVVVANSVSSYILNVLSSNTSYDFQLTKITDVNSPVSSVVTDSTLAIQASAPTLSVVSKTSTSVSLSWNPRGNHGDAIVTSYELEYKKASDLNFVSTSHPSSAFGADIVGLEPETSYNFRVIKNTNINSPVSNTLLGIVTDPLAVVLDFDPIDFNYNGSEQIWTSPGDGTILVWLQGGTGGNYGTYLGGEGGFIEVEIDVQKDVAYKIRVAGPGVDRSAGRHAAGGGGASGVFDPTTNTWMAIAGGGGGGADRGSGGAGGVPTIWNGTNGGGPNVASYGKLGTITSVGLGGTGRRNALAGALHDGGNGGTEGTGPYAGGYGVGSGGLGGKGGNDYAGGGGGGGWFGGGGGGIASDGHGAGGGGGSSYYGGTNTNISLSSTRNAKYLDSINGFVRISPMVYPRLVHHYDFSTQSLTEQVSGVAAHALVSISGSGAFETVNGDTWYRMGQGQSLQTTSLPPMPTKNYTLQMEFITNDIDEAVNFMAIYGQYAGDGVASDILTLKLHLFGSLLDGNNGFIEFKNQQMIPPHSGTSPDGYSYRSSAVFRGKTLNWPDGSDFVMADSVWGHHVLTGAYNFDQEGTDLIANKGKLSLYLDNKLMLETPLNVNMVDPMMFLGQTLRLNSNNAAPNYFKHIRMYDGVIDQSMLDALPTAI